MFTLWILWAVLTVLVISLAIARKFAARNENDLLHLSVGAETAISEQTYLAQKLEKIDQWGKRLTVVDVLFGAVLAGITVFTAWQQSISLEK
jgi:uncharacterized membrane protein